MNLDSDNGIQEAIRRAGERRTEPSVVRAEFNRLADRWTHDVEYISSATEIIQHPAYQRIIGMGRPVIPLLLKELKDRPHHWFWALQCIAGEEPESIQETESFEQARQAWLDWGERNGWIG